MTALLLALLLSSPAHPAADQSLGTITLLQGSLTLIRGANIYRGLEGMHLKHGDILETSDGGFAQLEFSTGIIALGPSSRLYILKPGGSSGGRPVSLDVILLSGWLKSETAGTKELTRVRAPLLGASASGGAIVMRSSPSECDLFLESGGPATVNEISAGGDSGRPLEAKSRQFFTRQKGTPVVVSAKPSAAFVEAVPRDFRDTLPPRQSRQSQKPAEPKAEHPVSFEEIEPWLKIPASWRKGLADRFAPRLADPSFRKQIETHVREFPEWEPILHPKAASESP